MMGNLAGGSRGEPVEITDLSKLYGPVIALTNASLSLRAGEFVSLLGASGSGKSTLLKLIAGLEGATSGRILLGGVDATRLPSEKRDIGMVFQDYALFPTMTVAENIAFPLRMRRIATTEQQSRIAKVAQMVGIEALLARKPSQLSGGQQQRVAIARAIVFEPKILLLDEPLSALDKNLREQTKGEIKALHERLGVTVVYVTHDQSEALAMSDRIAVLDKGRIVDVGTPSDLYATPRSAFLATFLGQANLLPLRVTSLDGAHCTVDSAWGPFSVPLRNVSRDIVASPGAAALAVVRPEHLALAHNGARAEARRVTASVMQALYNGSETIYHARCGDTGLELTFRDNRPGRTPYHVGETMPLEVDVSFVVLVPPLKDRA
jgi:putative spermidine/putrescine transport system ATP-binding protein